MSDIRNIIQCSDADRTNNSAVVNFERVVGTKFLF